MLKRAPEVQGTTQYLARHQPCPCLSHGHRLGHACWKLLYDHGQTSSTRHWAGVHAASQCHSRGCVGAPCDRFECAPPQLAAHQERRLVLSTFGRRCVKSERTHFNEITRKRSAAWRKPASLGGAIRTVYVLVPNQCGEGVAKKSAKHPNLVRLMQAAPR